MEEEEGRGASGGEMGVREGGAREDGGRGRPPVSTAELGVCAHIGTKKVTCTPPVNNSAHRAPAAELRRTRIAQSKCAHTGKHTLNTPTPLARAQSSGRDEAQHLVERVALALVVHLLHDGQALQLNAKRSHLASQVKPTATSRRDDSRPNVTR
ncbi:hypothetical protein EYF80_035179 [Liparis tanakae]|uniref:Uncharacterized protein n=1 Tax=Liparis tanakae TaxID=230148 RepID=A0A4Z2GM31_9TELE|nr:hypothetical protein EYF80_035179 [Liparis tanakae]